MNAYSTKILEKSEWDFTINISANSKTGIKERQPNKLSTSAVFYSWFLNSRTFYRDDDVDDLNKISLTALKNKSNGSGKNFVNFLEVRILKKSYIPWIYG